MPFIAGGFFKFRDKQQTNSIKEMEEKTDCRTAASGLEKSDSVAGLMNFQTDSMKDEPLKTDSLFDSHDPNEKCEFQLMQTEGSMMCLNPKTFLSCHDIFTWKITNFLQLPMNEDYFIDSREFPFANSTWCLRMYPNGKKNHEGSMHLLLVLLQSSSSRYQIHYRLRLKVQDKDLYDSFTHIITLHGDTAEVGIIIPLQRLDVVNSLTSCAKDNFLVAICEIAVELSESPKALETSFTEELAEHNQMLNLPVTTSCKDIFVWEIKNFFQLPMHESYFIDSEKFSVENAEWCLRMYPNGQKGMNPGWIHLLLIRLQPSDSQQYIRYRLGLKMKGRNRNYEALTHFVTFHSSADKAGVLNLIERSDILLMKKKFARNGVLRVFCQIKHPIIGVINKAVQLQLPSEISLVMKLENSNVGVLEKISFSGAKDVIWKIPAFVIKPMQMGYWMDSPVFSFLDENWCLRLYMKEKKIGKDWKIYLYLVRFNTCCFMYLISYELSILDKSGYWLRFQKHNCQGIYESHVMKLGVSNLHFTPDGFVTICFQMLSKEGLTEASNLTDKPRYLEFPKNDVEVYGPSLFQHGMLFQKPFLATTEIVWTIPAFVKLRKSVVDSVNSPVFEFGGDTWFLHLYPNGFENTPGRISFVMSRLFTSVMKQHIICHFSIRNSATVISRCKLENVFEGSSKSYPVHLELPQIMSEENTIVPDGILTVFCQIYIVSECEVRDNVGPITKEPSNAMNQFRYGFLFQQSFSSVTDMTWEIPNFLAFESDGYCVNSPVFNFANEMWLLQLFPNGYETSAENISLVLVRLFPSDINHHIICRFSVKNTNNVVDGKGSCENIFKDEILKSSPIHLKKFKRKQEEEGLNDLLTVFCQMYIIEDKKSIAEPSSESVRLKEMKTFSLDDMKQFMHGTLVQQLFLAATEVTWKIPDFFRLIKKQEDFINSPVFGLNNNTWLLRLYLKGNAKNMRKCYCILVRSFPSNLDCHVIWKINIKNKKNMVIESGTCESTYRKKIAQSLPIHLEPSKIMNSMKENFPQDVLMLFCQMYIIDDNRETVIKASSHVNQPKSAANKDLCVGDIVILKERENKSQEGFQNSQDLISEGECCNALGNGKDINEDFSKLNLTDLEKKKKKNTVINQLDAECPIPEKKMEENLVRNEDLCIKDMVDLKENEHNPHLTERCHDNSKDSTSNKGKSDLQDGKDSDTFWDDLDFTRLKKKKKKKNATLNQLEAECPLPEEKNNANINITKTEDRCTVDMIVPNENENNCHLSEGFQNNSQDPEVKDEFASVNAFKVFDADINTLTEDEKINNNNQLDARYPNKEFNDAVELEKVKKIHQECENVSLCEKDCVTFLVRGEEIQIRLSAFKEQSTIFASVIQSGMNISSTVIIDNSDPQIFKTFLLYLYTGQVDVFTSKNMFGLYSIANKYGMHKLKMECLKFMKNIISVNTVCDIMAFSFQNKENEIYELTTCFFLKNVTKITSTVKWQEFLKENYILASELAEKVLKN